MFIKANYGRTVCTEISGLTPNMMKKSGKIQEIKLSDNDNSLIGTGYTSQYVKDIIKDQVFKRSRKFSSISESMCQLIDNGLITPIMFSNNDDYTHIIESLNVYQYEKRIMGFFDIQLNSIFLCLNNLSIGATGSISDSNIISLVVHELMHYAFKNHFLDYKRIWDKSMMAFYKTFFEKYLFVDCYPIELIRSYLDSMYNMELKGDTKRMFQSLDDILHYAEKHNNNEDFAYANFKALEKLFQYLSSEPSNEVGVQIGKLSRSFFNETFQETYNKIFFAINPTMSNYYLYDKTIKDHNYINIVSTFYQEFIASSEVSAMLAGTLVKELYTQQSELDRKNPVAELINSIV